MRIPAKKNSRIYGLILFSIFLFACGLTASPSALPPAPPTQVFTTTPSSTPTLTFTPTETSLPTVTSTPAPFASRVLIVTFDGLRPDAIDAAVMQNTLALMQMGAYTLTAQTVYPSVTLPAHSSLFVGVCPSKHIVRWNEYVPQNGYAIGVDLFDIAHRSGMRTVMVVGKEKLSQITEPSSLDFYTFVDNTDKIVDQLSIEQLAIQQIQLGFQVMFVHFPQGDLDGHEYGWMSRRQLETYATDDLSLGRILESLRANGMYESTLIVVTSDHGGHDTTHGENISADMNIPWIISGPGVKHSQLTAPVNIMDTAATAAYALGLTIPPEWDGVPIYEAFGQPVIKQSLPCQ